MTAQIGVTCRAQSSTLQLVRCSPVYDVLRSASLNKLKILQNRPPNMRQVATFCGAKFHGPPSANWKTGFPNGRSGTSFVHALNSRNNQIRAVSCDAQETQVPKEERSFLAKNTDFIQSGVHKDVAKALASCGFDIPTKVQAKSLPLIGEGKNVVIAAETGSGKTLAYLAPIASLLMNNQQVVQVDEDDELQKRNWPVARAVVLCPNAQLVSQVAQVARQLADKPDQQPLFSTTELSRYQGLYKVRTDLLVSTPGMLLNEMMQAGVPSYRREIFFRSIRHLVLDEVDMLMAGGFAREVRQIMQLMARWKPEDRLFQDGALTQDGKAAVPEDAEAPWGAAWDNLGEDEKAAIQEAANEDFDQGEEDPAGELSEDEVDVWPCLGGETAQDLKHKRRQLVFVGATIPQNGKKSVGATIKTWYPNATWVQGAQLHRSLHQTQHDFQWVEEQNKREALLAAVWGGGTDQDDPAAEGVVVPRTIVFANSTQAVDDITALLIRGSEGEVGEVRRYHRNVPPEERTQNLEDFKNGIFPVLVCTDSAARGIDIPDIQHVVQAEFALGAVDFLHRVGRTGRAGKSGRVTSLYGVEQQELAQAVSQQVQQHLPVEDAFSRKRSFRKKFKKYGPSRKGVSTRSAN